jgi:hypothetical protein
VARGRAEQRHGGIDLLLRPPLSHGGGCRVQFEVELTGLDQLETLRHRGGGPGEDAGDWMRAFSEILLSPPGVEILRVDGGAAAPGSG